MFKTIAQTTTRTLAVSSGIVFAILALVIFAAFLIVRFCARSAHRVVRGATIPLAIERGQAFDAETRRSEFASSWNDQIRMMSSK